MCLPPKPKPDILSQCFMITELHSKLKQSEVKIKILKKELKDSVRREKDLIDLCEAYKISLENI